MKSFVQLIAGLFAFVAVIHSIVTGYIPNRSGEGGTYASESPGTFLLQVSIFGAIGIVLLYRTWKQWSE